MNSWGMGIDSPSEVPWQTVMPQPTQPQVHAMLPSTSQQGEVRKYKVEDWDVHRQEITRLYENDTLKNVMKFMRERYGLEAT